MGPSSSERRRTIGVLVVTSSEDVGRSITSALAGEGDLEAVATVDPFGARPRVDESPPDVLLLDLDMPGRRGLELLQRLRQEHPTPIVVLCSGRDDRAAGTALRALQQGALEVVAHPRSGASDPSSESGILMLDAVRAAARARRPPSVEDRSFAGERLSLRPSPQIQDSDPRDHQHLVVVIGAATGGPQALRDLLSALPPDAPGMVIVQHLPEILTAPFAKSLDEISPLRVKEAADGDPVLPGTALIAPGGRHLALLRRNGGLSVHTVSGPLVRRHRPSIDVLFRSAAGKAGEGVLGILLTGMGEDGAEGLLEIRQAGGRTIAQDEATAILFDMPQAAISRGGVERVLSLQEIAEAISQPWGSLLRVPLSSSSS